MSDDNNTTYIVVEDPNKYKKLEDLFDVIYDTVLGQPFRTPPPYNVTLVTPEYDLFANRIHEWVTKQYSIDFINNFIVQNAGGVYIHNKIIISYQQLYITIVKPEYI